MEAGGENGGMDTTIHETTDPNKTHTITNHNHTKMEAKKRENFVFDFSITDICPLIIPLSRLSNTVVSSQREIGIGGA